jgi:hypothetical protein
MASFTKLLSSFAFKLNLRPCNPDEKVLVFAQWADTVAAVAVALGAAAADADACNTAGLGLGRAVQVDRVKFISKPPCETITWYTALNCCFQFQLVLLHLGALTLLGSAAQRAAAVQSFQSVRTIQPCPV